MDINHEQCESCSQLCFEYRATPAFVVPERGYTFEEAQKLVQHFCAFLQQVASDEPYEFPLVQGYFTKRPDFPVGHVVIQFQVRAKNSIGTAWGVSTVVLPSEGSCNDCPF
jgi:hypothetical protein